MYRLKTPEAPPSASFLSSIALQRLVDFQRAHAVKTHHWATSPRTLKPVDVVLFSASFTSSVKPANARDACPLQPLDANGSTAKRRVVFLKRSLLHVSRALCTTIIIGTCKKRGA